MLEKRTPKSADGVALAVSSGTTNYSDQAHTATPKPQGPDKSFAEVKASFPESLLQTLSALEDLVQSFGDDMQYKELRLYSAFKKLRNFATGCCSALACWCMCTSMRPYMCPKSSSTPLQRVMCLPLATGAREILRCPSASWRSCKP